MKYLFIALSAFLMVACSQEEEVVEQAKEKTPSELRVVVNNTDAVSTRASINGVFTSLGVGDQIGLFALDEEGNVVYDNIPFTCVEDMKWNPSDNIKLSYSSNYTYYAYYPYKEDLEGYIYYSDEDLAVEDVFVNIIAQWDIPTDQGTLDKHLAADLMAGKGSSNNQTGTVTFTLEHLMGLLQISIVSGDESVDIEGMDSYEHFRDDENSLIPYNDGTVFRFITKPTTDEIRYYPFVFQMEGINNSFEEEFEAANRGEILEKEIDIVN